MKQTNLCNSISEALLITRKRSKMTQEEFSKVIGISRSHYSDIETGKSNPSLEVLDKINCKQHIFFIDIDADRKNWNEFSENSDVEVRK